MVYIVEWLVLHRDNLCTKKGNSSIFEHKIRGLSSREVSNQEQVIMACVRYIFLFAFIYQLLSSSKYCFDYQYLIYGWLLEG